MLLTNILLFFQGTTMPYAEEVDLGLTSGLYVGMGEREFIKAVVRQTLPTTMPVHEWGTFIQRQIVTVAQSFGYTVTVELMWQ